MCTLAYLWSALQGVGAIGVAVIAALGLVAAFRQINEVRASRTEAANIARTQRTTELLAEFGTDDMEYSFGFFDAAYSIADSLIVNGMRYVADFLRRLDAWLRDHAGKQWWKGTEFDGWQPA